MGGADLDHMEDILHMVWKAMSAGLVCDQKLS